MTTQETVNNTQSTTSLYNNIRNVINLIDNLSDAGINKYIALPRIVVVGTQSAGKSSVIESIVGYDFLPRGDGVVTRRPLELRLAHRPNTVLTASFPNNSPEKFSNLAQVKNKIQQYTDEIAGKNKGIVSEPLVLNISGPECPDLSLIDLPGITRVPIKNSDQTEEIEQLTREMSYNYVKDEKTIILAVIPANQDISTSDALQLARKVDPEGNRTIGVVTKLDLMDKGTNAVSILQGELVPLKLGFIAVKNRSQFDNQKGLSIDKALELEKTFFSTKPEYKKLSKDMLGTQALIDKLTKVLFSHIKLFLPDIKAEIQTELREARSELALLGNEVPINKKNNSHIVWTCVNDFCTLFNNLLAGKYDERLVLDNERDLTELCGGSQLRQVYDDLLSEEYQDNMLFELSQEEIKKAISLHQGVGLPGFLSLDTFEFLILPHLQNLRHPALQCLEKSTNILEALLERVGSRIFQRFPNLGYKAVQIAKKVLNENKNVAHDLIDSIITAETGFLYTNNNQYHEQNCDLSIPPLPTTSKMINSDNSNSLFLKKAGYDRSRLLGSTVGFSGQLSKTNST
uniref:Dynamin-A-like n=1 Tax=Dermatophagoides pteronyssinus TaxID=6956 RepID=A0A6P6YBM8_DERPT|nr:dynamin-A-like [Dermatophagoides pteronyssinus]